MKTRRPRITEHAHPKLVELVEKCWEQDPTQRPDFPEIFGYISNLCSVEVNFFSLVLHATKTGWASQLVACKKGHHSHHDPS